MREKETEKEKQRTRVIEKKKKRLNFGDVKPRTLYYII